MKSPKFKVGDEVVAHGSQARIEEVKTWAEIAGKPSDGDYCYLLSSPNWKYKHIVSEKDICRWSKVYI